MSTISDAIDRALDAGLRDRASGVRRTIDAALRAAGLVENAPTDTDAPAPPTATTLTREQDGVYAAAESTTVPTEGRFTWHPSSGRPGSLRYKLYVPISSGSAPMPLIVMLHGCKQNPDDFAAGTQMNRLAEAHGFAVAYPEQTHRANGSNCWNWFEDAQQRRGGREPEAIAGMVKAIADQVAIDPERIYIAGLSAGAAMAVVLAQCYPEVFAGVAVHSGLPMGSAHDVPSAFAAMRGQGAGNQARMSSKRSSHAVRTIVFHGDVDSTVAIANGQAVVSETIAAYEGLGTPLRRSVETSAANGLHSTRTDHVDSNGQVMVRDFRVRGGGHTWFGGSSRGTYTDARGPDASAEIVAFFLRT